MHNLASRWITIAYSTPNMMTSSNGNIFSVTDPKASDAELWCFLWSNDWLNNCGAGDLRCHRAHYVVIVMDMATPMEYVAMLPSLLTEWLMICHGAILCQIAEDYGARTTQAHNNHSKLTSNLAASNGLATRKALGSVQHIKMTDGSISICFF